MSHLFDILRVAQGHFAYVETAKPFAEEIHGVAISGKHRITVFYFLVGQVGKFTRLQVVNPDIAADRGGVVLAPFVFVAFAVMVKYFVAIRRKADVIGFKRQHLLRAPAFQVNGIDLPAAGELPVCLVGLDVGAEKDVLAVRGEAFRNGIAAEGGQPCRRAPGYRQHVQIHSPVTSGGEGDGLAVRGPYRMVVVCRMRGQLGCLAAFCRHKENVPFVTKSDGLAVRGNRRITCPQWCLLGG